MGEENNIVYISILTDTLNKKSKLLDALKHSVMEQSVLLDKNPLDIELFENTMETKDSMLKELENLDMGFERVYQRASNELKQNKARYKQEIQNMQELIRRISACSADIQVLEEKNKKKFQFYLSNQRNTIKVSVRSNQTASAYYKNMADQHQSGESYFLDKRK